MLKWTKFHRKEKASAKTETINNNLSDKAKNLIVSLAPSGIHSSCEHPATPGDDTFSTSSSNTGGNLTEAPVTSSETEIIGAFGLENSRKRENLSLNTGQCLISTSHQRSLSSASLSKPSAFVATETPQNQAELDAEMSLKASSETIPKSGVSVSDSSQSVLNTALTNSDIDTATGDRIRTLPSHEPALPSEPGQSDNTSSALPDITKIVPGTDREILGPEVEWEQEDLIMKQVVDNDNFPCVCFFQENRRENDGRWEFLSAGLKIYSRQPVLFHMHTKKRQARARTISKDPRGAYYEVGQTLIIPEDYQGWFEVVPSDFSRATCFMSISEVSKAMPRKFFTRSNIKGIRIEDEGDNQKYLERKISAGSVLETNGTFTAKWRTRAETGLFKKKTTEWEMQEVTYLKCVDRDKQEILVPMTHKGKFNAIYEKGRLTQNAVYSMKDILSDLSLPVKVRLLFGKAPVVPCIFTGMLVVRNAFFDDAVVGSTILNARNVLFEIPVNAPVKVKYLSKDQPFAEMTTYKDAQKLCKKYANMFSTMIKLSPDLDTDQKVIMHVPTDPSLMRKTEEALRALDLITDISFTGEPQDHLLDSSDSSSQNSDEQTVIPRNGKLEALTEFKSRESHTSV